MRFVVFGAGAIGGVVGGRLVQSGYNVVFVARGAHRVEMTSRGLHLHSPAGVDKLDVRVVGEPSEAGLTAGDIVLLAVKSQHTVEALDGLAAVADPSLPIVCVQNGVVNEREALRRFENVYGASVMCPTAHLAPGHVVAYSSPTTGIIDVGRYPSGTDGIVEEVVDALGRSTFSSVGRDDVARWKWAKLITNLGNAIEAVCGPPARTGPIGELATAEAHAVLDAAGIDHATAAEDRERRADHVTRHPVDGQQRPGGSSWQSLARRTGSIETDYLNGEIVMLGRIHRVPTPVNAALQAAARSMASAGALPGSVSERDFLSHFVRSRFWAFAIATRGSRFGSSGFPSDSLNAAIACSRASSDNSASMIRSTDGARSAKSLTIWWASCSGGERSSSGVVPSCQRVTGFLRLTMIALFCG